jgi:hypothetical protein
MRCSKVVPERGQPTMKTKGFISTLCDKLFSLVGSFTCQQVREIGQRFLARYSEPRTAKVWSAFLARVPIKSDRKYFNHFCLSPLVELTGVVSRVSAVSYAMTEASFCIRGSGWAR